MTLSPTCSPLEPEPSQPTGPCAERTVLATMVHLYLMFAVKCGLSADALLATAGITQAQIAVHSDHVPYRWLWTIRDEVIRQRPDLCLGLEAGLFMNIDQYGFMGQSLKHAASPRAAIALWNQLVLQVHRGPFEPPTLHDRAGLTYWTMPRMPDEHSESFESTFVGAVMAVRNLTGEPTWRPHAVYFTRCAPRHLPVLEAFFQAPVHSGADDNVAVFESRAMDVAQTHADVTASAHFRAHFEQQVVSQGDPFCAAVLRAIEAGMVLGQLSQTLVAKQFGLTPRTLQRRCRERGVHYRDLVAEARRTAALRLLRDRSLNIHDVAVALGYDASSFNRVFRGWTGVSPSVYRRQAVAVAVATAHVP